MKTIIIFATIIGAGTSVILGVVFRISCDITHINPENKPKFRP